MKLISKPLLLQKLILEKKRKGKIITFVPTMGALHEGHLSLVKEARLQGDILVLSIFVNPEQFGLAEDYKRYPRPFNKDKILAQKNNVDILFCPSVKDMYPLGYSTYAEEESLSRTMCSFFRPGHFRGVTTVVLKLFNIVQPDIAFFGQKDYQQALVIKKMTKDLNLPVEIIVLPTVREKDGLAMSSRNQYLSCEERKKAVLFYRMLKERKIIKDKSLKIEYFVKVDKDTLKQVKRIRKGRTLMAIAGRIGKTRLIDNIIV